MTDTQETPDPTAEDRPPFCLTCGAGIIRREWGETDRQCYLCASSQYTLSTK